MKTIKNPKIVLVGSVFSTKRVFEGLLRHKMNLVGVLGLAPEVSKKVSGYVNMQEIVKDFGLPYKSFININDPETIAFIRGLKPDLLFVIGLSQIVKDSLLSVPSIGCVGFHPTLLPYGRGRAPIAWLILQNSPGAATFFLMDRGVDSGPILVQEPFFISSKDYVLDVVKKIEIAIDRALDRWLPMLKNGILNLSHQNEKLATYYGVRKPKDGNINWEWPAEKIYDLIRATSYPYPGAYTYVKEYKLIIWKSKVEKDPKYLGVPGRILAVDDGKYLVQTGKGALWLEDVEIYPQDKKLEELLKVGVKLGIDCSDEIRRIKKKVRKLEQILLSLLDEEDRKRERKGEL